jgi:hypothetical protein
MKIELDADETWELMSAVVARLLDEAPLADADRARVRRWRSDEMRPSGEPLRVLTAKINDDLAAVMARKRRSPIRKRDRG